MGRWRTGRSGSVGPTVVAVHGVTGNHLAWSLLARHSPYEVVAPDLRGRGRSSGVAGPAGMRAHTADLCSVLDHLELDRAILVGHSMGGFVVSCFAAAHPDRVASVLLVDGGLPLPEPPAGLSPDEVVAATIGPAAQRLEMTFADTGTYLDFWRDHPALGPAWSPEVAAYFAYDLVGDPPSCRSSVSLAAVRDDSVDLLDTMPVAERVRALPAGTTFLRATHGMMGDPGGLYPRDLVEQHAADFPQLRIRDVDDTNHYTLVMSEPGARTVAAALTGSTGED